MHLKWFGSYVWMLLIVVQSCRADSCNSEGFYCVSDTEFQLCVDGETVGDPISCKSGLTCRNNAENESNPQMLCRENKTCSAEGTFPDEKFINKYFTCTLDTSTLEWIKNEFTCHEGKYFSQETNTCIVGDSSTSVIESENTIIYDQDQEYSLSNVGDLCPAKGNFPDPRDCQSFYTCSGLGIGKLMKCPQGTYFNDEISVCSNEIPERCASTNFKPDMSSQTENPSQDLFVCPGAGYFIDPRNEQRYFVCDEENNLFTRHCPESTFFDPAIVTCVAIEPERHPDLTTNMSEQTKTDNFKEETYSTTNNYETSTPKYDRAITTAYPTEDDRYSTITDVSSPTETSQTEDDYETSTPENDQVITTEYQSEHDYFSTTVRHTSTTNQPLNNDINDSNFACPGVGYFPDPKNCHYYYFCLESMDAIPVSCQDNTYFNEETTFCSTEMPERCREINELPNNHPFITVTTESNSVISTTPSASEDDHSFICPSKGYFPDPKNCQYYYLCLGNNFSIPVSCPENEFYDEDSTFCTSERPERCNSVQFSLEGSGYQTKPTNNELESATPSTPPEEPFVCPGYGYFPNPRNCRGYFGCFEFGITAPILCPEGTYFDERYGLCTSEIPERCTEGARGDWVGPQEPEDEKEFMCPDQGIFPDPRNCTKYWICITRNFGFFVTCPRGTYYHKRSSICLEEVPETCRGLSDEQFKCTKGGYFADPQNCHIYHVCYSGGIHLSINCPQHTYYDEESQICTYNTPERCWNARNRADRSTNALKGSRTDTPEARVQNTERLRRRVRQIIKEVEDSTTPDPSVCPGQGLFPDPKNCSKFYSCIDGVRQLSCRMGMYYDDVTEMCGEEFPERCNRTQTDPDVSNVAPTTTFAAFVCPGRGRFPDPTDCTKYYNCFGPNPRQLSCRTGMYYDDVTEMCGEEFPERCNRTQTDPDVTTVAPTTPAEFVCPGRGRFPDPTDCTKYYNCFGPKPRQLSCRTGMYYDDVTEMCGEEFPERCNGTHSDDSTRISRTTTPLNCSGEGLLPDPTDCTKFYNCLDSARRLSCRPGMYYDDVTKMCGKEIPESCSQEQGNGMQDTPAPSIITPSVYAIVCPDEGVFVDLKNCSKYYDCRGIPQLRSCPNGTYFNNKTQLCGSEIPVGCEISSGMNTSISSLNLSTTLDLKFECSKPGRYPDPKDCQKYFFCNTQLEMSHQACRYSMYFNEITNSCEDEIPERCLPDISGVWNSEGLSSPPDFICRGRGNFVNKEDRSSYYYCPGENFNPTQRKCPNGHYFYENENKCKMENDDSHSDEESQENSKYSSEESREW